MLRAHGAHERAPRQAQVLLDHPCWTLALAARSRSGFQHFARLRLAARRPPFGRPPCEGACRGRVPAGAGGGLGAAGPGRRAILGRSMLETLTQGFTAARDRLAGVREITEENIDEALRDVRMSLLEADVDFAVVKDFLARVKERVARRQGRDPRPGCPGPLDLGHAGPALRQDLRGRAGRADGSGGPGARPRLRGPDLGDAGGPAGRRQDHRGGQARRLPQKRTSASPCWWPPTSTGPPPSLQLQQLGERIGVAVHAGAEGESPAAICRAAAERARNEGFNAVIYDTAGRLAIDDDLMAELEEIVGGHRAGQHAAGLRRADGSRRRQRRPGVQRAAEARRRDPDQARRRRARRRRPRRQGTSPASRSSSWAPARPRQLEEFRPEGLASRILGMGDIVGLVRTSRRSSTRRRPRRTRSACSRASSASTTC